MNEDKKNRGGNPNPSWVKGGPSPNKNGRPKGTGKPVSKLRNTLNKLRELETKALENIKNSVEGKEVDKETLATSKWVVTTAVAVSRAAQAEEALKHDIKKYNEELEAEEKATGTNDAVPVRPRFSTTLQDI